MFNETEYNIINKVTALLLDTLGMKTHNKRIQDYTNYVMAANSNLLFDNISLIIECEDTYLNNFLSMPKFKAYCNIILSLKMLFDSEEAFEQFVKSLKIKYREISKNPFLDYFHYLREISNNFKDNCNNEIMCSLLFYDNLMLSVFIILCVVTKTKFNFEEEYDINYLMLPVVEEYTTKSTTEEINEIFYSIYSNNLISTLILLFFFSQGHEKVYINIRFFETFEQMKTYCGKKLNGYLLKLNLGENIVECSLNVLSYLFSSALSLGMEFLKRKYTTNNLTNSHNNINANVDFSNQLIVKFEFIKNKIIYKGLEDLFISISSFSNSYNFECYLNLREFKDKQKVECINENFKIINYLEETCGFCFRTVNFEIISFSINDKICIYFNNFYNSIQNFEIILQIIDLVLASILKKTDAQNKHVILNADPHQENENEEHNDKNFIMLSLMCQILRFLKKRTYFSKHKSIDVNNFAIIKNYENDTSSTVSSTSSTSSTSTSLPESFLLNSKNVDPISLIKNKKEICEVLGHRLFNHFQYYIIANEMSYEKESILFSQYWSFNSNTLIIPFNYVVLILNNDENFILEHLKTKHKKARKRDIKLIVLMKIESLNNLNEELVKDYPFHLVFRGEDFMISVYQNNRILVVFNEFKIFYKKFAENPFLMKRLNRYKNILRFNTIIFWTPEHKFAIDFKKSVIFKRYKYATSKNILEEYFWKNDVVLISKKNGDFWNFLYNSFTNPSDENNKINENKKIKLKDFILKFAYYLADNYKVFCLSNELSNFFFEKLQKLKFYSTIKANLIFPLEKFPFYNFLKIKNFIVQPDYLKYLQTETEVDHFIKNFKKCNKEFTELKSFKSHENLYTLLLIIEKNFGRIYHKPILQVLSKYLSTTNYKIFTINN